MYVIDEKELNKSYVVDTKKFSLSKLKYTVQQLENLSFVDGKNSLNGKDILGDFFEGIIRDGFKQTKGQFFTPINIVRFMLYASSADKLAIDRIKNDKVIPYMVDPSAGFRVIIVIEANSYVNIKSSRLLPKFKTQKINSWCAA